MAKISAPPSDRSIFNAPPNFPSGVVHDAWLAWFQAVQANTYNYPAPVAGYALGWDNAGNIVNVPNTGADQFADLANTTDPTKGAGRIGYGAVSYPVGTVGYQIAGRVSRSELAETLDPSTGAALVGFNPSLVYTSNTVGSRLNDLASASAGKGAALVGSKKSWASAVATTLHEVGERTIEVMDALTDAQKADVLSSGKTLDTAPAIQAAIDAASLAGGGTVILPRGTLLIGSSLKLRAKVWLKGQGMDATTLFLKGGTNADMISNYDVGGTVGCGISDMFLHGNEYLDFTHGNNPTGNTAGSGINWNSGSVGDGPGIVARNLRLSHFYGGASGSGTNAAVALSGSVWPIFDNVRIVDNKYAGGMWVKVSEGLYNGVYVAGNGAYAAIPNCQVVLQGGVNSKFIGCYFGGSWDASQVFIYGSSFNEFIGCVNDASGRAGYSFERDNANATDSLYNRITGGQISAASKVGQGGVDNAYAAVEFRDTSAYNTITGTLFYNQTAGVALAKAAVYETGTTVGNNLVTGCSFQGYDTPIMFRAGGLSQVVAAIGYTPSRHIAAHYRYSGAAIPGIASGTETVINFDTKIKDTNNTVTTGAGWVFTAPCAGTYSVKAMVTETFTGGNTMLLYLKKNGSTSITLASVAAPAFSGYAISGTTDIELAAGDTLKVAVTNYGSAYQIDAGGAGNGCWVSIVRHPGSEVV